MDITAITHANARCYVWLYNYWLFMFDCICAVLRGSLLYISCGLSAVEINELLLLLLLLLTGTFADNSNLTTSVDICPSS